MKATIIRPDRGEGSWSALIAARSEEMYQAFSDLGVQLQILDQTRLVSEPKKALAELARFNPDFLTAPNFNYLLLASVNDNSLLHLDIPTVALWDDPLGAIVNYYSWFYLKGRTTPYKPGRLRWALSRVGDAWHRLRKATGWAQPESRLAPLEYRDLLANPYWLHFAWDSGHAEAFASLGLARPEQIIWHPVATYSPFLQMGERAATLEQTTDIAYCGNVYLEAMQQHPKWQDTFLRGIAERVVERKMANLGGSLWDFLSAELDQTRPSLRRCHGLYTDHNGFWEFYLFLAWTVMTTLPRVRLLRALGREVHLFGIFADPASRQLLGAQSNLKFAGDLEHFEELPRQFATTKINLCLTNGLIYKGTPSKLMDCLASGGFALCEPKDDLVRMFGSKAEAIFFRSAEELNAKVDYYLARPAARREITEALRMDVKKHCPLHSLFGRVIDTVREFKLPLAA